VAVGRAGGGQGRARAHGAREARATGKHVDRTLRAALAAREHVEHSVAGDVGHLDPLSAGDGTQVPAILSRNAQGRTRAGRANEPAPSREDVDRPPGRAADPGPGRAGPDVEHAVARDVRELNRLSGTLVSEEAQAVARLGTGDG